MMKTLLSLQSFILALLFISCREGDNKQARKDEIRTVWTSYYDALAKKDVSKMNDITTTDFIMYDDGIIYTTQSAVASLAAMGAFTASFSFDSLNVHMDRQNASAYCFRSAKFVINDSAYPSREYLESATFRKVDGNWKLRFIHSTSRKQ